MKIHIRLGLVFLLGASATLPLRAQQPAPRPPAQPTAPAQVAAAQAAAAAQAKADSARALADSLAERVRQAEEGIQRLRQQLEEQAQSKVQSRLRNRVEISGLVLVNGFYNGAKFNNADVPQFVAVPQDTSGLPNSAIGGVIRQTRLGITASGAHALKADLSGDLQVDFFGGQQASSAGRTHPLLRIRTASLRLDWPHLGLLIGQESPLVAQQNPVSFASSGFPDFAAAGNLWLWIPQTRLTYEAGRAVRLGVQAAALAPMLPSPQTTFLTQSDSAEKSGRPSVEARIYVGWGSDETESTIGLGAHRGWIATTGDTTLASQALTIDFRIAYGVVSIAGEAFTGQALAGLGGGGIGQNLGPDNRPVRTRGGWAQLDVRPTFAWEVGAGYGMDDPNDCDLGGTTCGPPATARLKNVVYEGHLHWRPGGGLLLGAEFRRFRTTYTAGAVSATHINGFVGMAF